MVVIPIDYVVWNSSDSYKVGIAAWWEPFGDSDRWMDQTEEIETPQDTLPKIKRLKIVNDRTAGTILPFCERIKDFRLRAQDLLNEIKKLVVFIVIIRVGFFVLFGR